MSDTTLIEIECQLNELRAEVARLHGQLATPQRRLPTRRASMALVLAAVLATMPFATGAQSPGNEILRLEKSIAALEQKLAQPLTVKAPFQVVDAGGTVVMRAEMSGGQPQLRVGTDETAGVQLGVGASGTGFVVVRVAGGKIGAAVGQHRGAAMGVRILGSDGQSVEGSLALDSNSKGQLRLGDARTGGVSAGVGTLSTAGFVIVHRADGKSGIQLGQVEGRPMSVGVFGENDKELVSLRTDAKGGTMRVMTPEGVSVAGLLASGAGGGLELTGPAGGKSAVSIGVTPSGGKVRVFPSAGGPAHAELTAESAGGAMTLYTSSGAPSAVLQTAASGAGSLEISRSGTIFVEAGVVNGRGIVRTGPTVGGPPIGALGFATTIMGTVK